RMSGDRSRDVVLADAERGAGNLVSAERRLHTLLADPRTSESDQTEARIVLSGIAADRGDLAEAQRVLERGPVSPKALEEHHLRLWYALGDVAERRADRA